MNEQSSEQKILKTRVFNVVILDRSGSMSSIRQAAIDGFNETLAGIRKAQEKFADTQEHYVSLVAFCNCETTTIFDKAPVKDTHPLTKEEYQPCCGTPLYDAMGFTLTGMRKYVKEQEDAVVVVTIITDGMENSSKEYRGSDIRKLVEELRGEGWSFTYMGANQNSVEVAMSLSIRNSRDFAYSDEGTRCCMQKDSATRMNFFDKLNDFKEREAMSEAACCMSRDERNIRYTAMLDEAFDEEEQNG